MGNPEVYPQCNGKSCYTKNQAHRAKKIVGKHRDKDMRIYLCDECHFYHLTKKHNEHKFRFDEDKR